MVLKICMRLTSVVIRTLRPQCLSVYTALRAFVRHQPEGPASSMIPGNRWAATAIAAFVALWLLWSLHGQFSPYDSEVCKVDQAQEVQHAKALSFHSNPRPLPIASHINIPAIEPPASSAPPVIAAVHDAERADRPLILYAYAESENARANLQFFLKKGLHGQADFVFIFNGEAPEAVKLIPPELPNVRVVQRANTCYDIGAFGEVLRSKIKVDKEGVEKDDLQLWERYKRFITMNASIRGPFLPVWSNECWTDAVLRMLSDKTKLVGLSYQCNPSAHLQSMLLATDHIGMSILMDPALAYSVPNDDPPHGTVNDPVGYSKCYHDFNKAVHSEIGMARLIQSQGYKVDALLTSVHVLGAAQYCERAAYPTDHLWDGMYFGFNVHPYEMLFMKANRDIDPELMKRMTEWHLGSQTSSWDTCGQREDSE